MEEKPHSHRLRLGRHSGPGGRYLLTTNCHARIPHFANATAARIALDVVRWLDDANRIELLAVVVMPDHLHLVAALCDGSLSHLMHALKGYSARRINDECGKRGPIWQAGYHDCALRDEAAVRAAVGYCLRNPLRAGLVAKVSEYPHLWSRVGQDDQSRL